MNTPTVTLFTGTPRYIGDAGQFSAIWKQPVAGPVRITREGLAGDAQADRRVHGGPEKAVHHYAGENYAKLAARFPQLADALVVGSIGENISTFGLDESTVCIGDVFRVGTAVLQVCQPRRPCWKIDARYGATGITAHIVDSGLTGWYYRVLEEGEARPGDAFVHAERPPGAVPLETLWTAWHRHRPDVERLAAIAAAPGLTPAWVKKIGDRLDWLAANPATAETGPGTSAGPAVKG
ncbi:MAG: MOSC domain-containing protein [Rhodocyclales bacterium]|nr:MOSC domain-containing protein [Rhodocyclales bacterium]